MEALLREFKVGCLWELLCTDDLVLMAETLEDLKKVTIWKDNIEAKELPVNVNKTKFVCSKYNSSVRSCKMACTNNIITMSQDNPEVMIGND